MNKSKFLKRSLAAILAILMVVAMVPSALAAQVVNESVPTARVFANPGYSIWVDNKEAQWDADNNAYTAEASFNEGSSLADDFNISMIQNVANTTVTVKETGDVLKNSNAQVPNAKADKKVDAFGAGTYTYTLVAEKTDADGVVVETNEYKLVITVTMKVKSADATIKAIKTAKMSEDNGTAIKTVKATFDNEKGTIDVVLALGQTVPAADINNTVARTIFIPSNSDARVMYDQSEKQIVVTAQNDSKKIYNVSFTWESAFDTFNLGDYVGKIDTKDAPTTVTIDLPYSFYDGSTTGDSSNIDIAEVNKLVATWTTENEVFANDGLTAKESGKTPLTFANATPGSGDTGYEVATAASQLTVKTKKSGSAQAVTIKVRVPSKNPSAELTGIQIGDDASTPAKPGTQYIPITGSTTTVTLPAGIKKTTDRVVTVWGADKATIELAKNEESGQEFDSTHNGVGTLTNGTATSDDELDLTAPLVFKVTSEDTKTTNFYTVNINEATTSAFPRLESVELIDDDEKVVATGTIDHSKKEVELVVPFATGIDNDALRDLTLRAKADSASRVGFGKAEVTAVTGEKAVYNVPATVLSNDGDLTIGGITVAIADVNTTNNTLDKQLDVWLVSATSSDWDLEKNADKNGIVFTAKHEGTIGGPAYNGNTPPQTAPAGGTCTNPGVDTVDAAPASFHEHIYIAGTALDDADIFDASGAITVPTAGKTEAGSGNTFQITAQNDNATNKESIYTVIVKKKAASKDAEILSGAEMASNNAQVTVNDTLTTYPMTVRGKTIKVNLPYALEKAAKANTATAKSMIFTKLDVSENAKVVWANGSSSALIGVTESSGTITSSLPITVWGADKDHSWATANQEITLLVFSEDAWYRTAETSTGTYDAKRLATISAALNSDPDYSKLTVPATAVYKMSATYAAAETGASLNSIKSTLDDRIKVELSSNTLAITVPGSYVHDTESAESNDADTQFSLNMDVSKLATIWNADSSGVELKSDKGSAKTTDRTIFTVRKNPSGDNKYDLYYKNSSTWTDLGFTDASPKKLYVISEDGTRKNSWNVKINVADKETSADIDSITAAGVSAVKDPADPYVWNLQISSTADKLQKMDIKTTSKLAGVTVDDAPYKPDDYYDLGADMAITVKSEDGNNVVNYTLKITDDGAAANTDLAEVRAGAYNGTKGANNAWVIKVPEGTDMSNPSLTLSTVDSSAKVTSVNGAAYTAGMTVDLSAGKTLTIVVTAADGSKGTHTVTCQFGAVDLSEQYKDIPTNYATDWIKKAINAGIMSNTGTASDGKLTFSPNAKTERMYFAMMVARADVMAKNDTITDKNAADKYIQSLYSGTPAFPDTTELNSDINAALEYCKKAEIFKGDEKGNFKPKDIVNRMEVASILANWLKLTEGGKENTHEFKDWANIPDWAKGNINAVADDKIMEGNANGTFGTGDLSRQDTAIIMMKAYDRLKESK